VTKCLWGYHPQPQSRHYTVCTSTSDIFRSTMHKSGKSRGPAWTPGMEPKLALEMRGKLFFGVMGNPSL
jgi:hypothetical protein